MRHFDLPVKVGTYVTVEAGETEADERRTTREEFYVPGSLLAIEGDTAHPLAAGCPPELAAMVNRRSSILEVIDSDAPIDVVATVGRSLAIAVGYSALVQVGQTVFNQTGKSLEVFAIWMGFYLACSLTISAVVNFFNIRLRIVER